MSFKFAAQKIRAAIRAKQEADNSALQGTVLGRDGSHIGNNTEVDSANTGQQKRTSLLSIRKRRDDAIAEQSANQNPVVNYSQGQVMLG